VMRHQDIIGRRQLDADGFFELINARAKAL
jgi:hypothetical protein